jgi:CHAD domain-containing protein
VTPGREKELKLSAPPSLRLPDLDGIADGITAVPREPVTTRATYLDTDDLRLARAGVTLRHRTGEGWTVKLPADSNGGSLVDSELTFSGDVRRPAPDALELVRAFARSAPLAPQARLRTVRRVVELRDEEDALVAEVCDDEVSVLDGRRVAARFRELEVELRPGGSKDLVERVADALREAGAGPPEQTPKLVRALGPRAEEPADAVVADAGEGTAGALVGRALAASVARLMEHDPVVRLDADTEGVHQMRVATRRLRSDLRTFAPFLDEGWSADLRTELGWLAGLLGRVRDADVLLDRLRRRISSLPDASAAGAASVLDALAGEREAALAELLEALRGDRYVELLDRLVLAVREPPLAEAAAGTAEDVLPEAARDRWHRLAKAAKALGRNPSVHDLHAVRIRTKRCRYAVEAIEPVLGKRASSFARDLARLQDRLGELNDAAVADGWLREFGRRRRGAAVFAAGELAGLELADAERARKRWRKAWKSASGAVPAALR